MADERIDMDQMRATALRERPKMIIAGATAYPRIIDPAPIREIADEIGALLMFLILPLLIQIERNTRTA